MSFCYFFLSYLFFIILSGCSDKRGLINYMIDRAISYWRGRLINTYLISRRVQFITSMTTRVLCFFSGSINPIWASWRWLKPTLWVVISIASPPPSFVGIWKLDASSFCIVVDYCVIIYIFFFRPLYISLGTPVRQNSRAKYYFNNLFHCRRGIVSGNENQRMRVGGWLLTRMSSAHLRFDTSGSRPKNYCPHYYDFANKSFLVCVSH